MAKAMIAERIQEKIVLTFLLPQGQIHWSTKRRYAVEAEGHQICISGTRL